MRTALIFFYLLIVLSISGKSQESVARKWNEVLLEGIRNDFARPTIHARNLCHISMAMYDAWAVYDNISSTYMLGRDVNGYKCNFDGFTPVEDIDVSRSQTISYAAYTMIKERFRFTPNTAETFEIADGLMNDLGYDISFESTDYSSGDARALGNYIADCILNYGYDDGSRENVGFNNIFYEPINSPLILDEPGNPVMEDPNRWQPLAFDTFIDQSGNEVPGGPSFLSPEWGDVFPFAMTEESATVFERDGDSYKVYHDPGPPAFIGAGQNTDDEYKWGFSLVSKWSAHLDPSDGVLIDISPLSIGNIPNYPETVTGLRDFYNEIEGGDPSLGRAINPRTNQPYTEQLVPRGDYTRVLAEFWADGPDSETPPGHWFTILNYVSDHPELEKKIKGEGEVVDDLEWDIKAYFVLGGAMHDAAISAWSIKGYYDYVRPISAIRYMAGKGQSSDINDMNYAVDGIPLSEGFVELVREGDELAGDNNENVGKIKLYSWRGPDFINDPDIDEAGVGWILADNWWPYQRPTFVTPPFAGYVSGHSTFSRAAAEVLTRFTGDEYFPGGLGEFVARQNEFLVFEEGPSIDVILQWATYRDASDQTSLSRIWGGIHPPVDDIPGRLIGETIGNEAFDFAEAYFNGLVTSLNTSVTNNSTVKIFPNPIQGNEVSLLVESPFNEITVTIIDSKGKKLNTSVFNSDQALKMSTNELESGVYFVNVSGKDIYETMKLMIVD